MLGELDLAVSWESLEDGTPEECAAFGQFEIRCGTVCLTEGYDHYIRALRGGPLVSGYHVAEWMAWNWWRLRWEPRRQPQDAPEWWRAHEMTAIGEGYTWPNLVIYSDGIRTVLQARRSLEPDAKPFRYMGALPCIVPSGQFEDAVDAFLSQILGRLDSVSLKNTTLHAVWQEVQRERSDPALTMRRRFEASLGFEPDHDEQAIDGLLCDAERLGAEAMLELAADHRQGTAIPRAANLDDLARSTGLQGAVGDRACLNDKSTWFQNLSEIPAWVVGKQIAQALRSQEGLGDGPITNDLLCTMAGLSANALEQDRVGSDISFVLDEQETSRVVLRSKWPTGRRFDLARLLGDCLFGQDERHLFPATRSHTYRQKFQRAFAAEFLAPFTEVVSLMGSDTSEESRINVAKRFDVSELTIRTALVNNNYLDRDELDEGVGQGFAAA